jgi:hypothetical protein
MLSGIKETFKNLSGHKTSVEGSAIKDPLSHSTDTHSIRLDSCHMQTGTGSLQYLLFAQIPGIEHVERDIQVKISHKPSNYPPKLIITARRPVPTSHDFLQLGLIAPPVQTLLHQTGSFEAQQLQQQQQPSLQSQLQQPQQAVSVAPTVPMAETSGVGTGSGPFSVMGTTVAQSHPLSSDQGMFRQAGMARLNFGIIITIASFLLVGFPGSGVDYERKPVLIVETDSQVFTHGQPQQASFQQQQQPFQQQQQPFQHQPFQQQQQPYQQEQQQQPFAQAHVQQQQETGKVDWTLMETSWGNFSREVQV